MTQTTTPVAFAPRWGTPSTLPRLLALPAPTWPHPPGLSDSQWLRPEEAVVPFDPSGEGFLQAQLDWAHASDHRLAVRLLTGQAGVGKTRLALALCQRLQTQGWQTGFLRHDCNPDNAAALGRLIWDAKQNFCIVLDDAQTRQPVLLTLLLTLLANRQPAQARVQVRVLLLARDSGDWWRMLPAKDATCEPLLEGKASSGPFEVQPLHDSETARQAAYQLALQTFAARLNITPPEHQPSLMAPHFARPLYLQMAALLALRGEQATSAESLAPVLVSHEQRFWRQAMTGLGGVGNELEQQATLLITLATLCKGIVSDRDIEPLWRALDQDKTQLKSLFKTLSPLYPDRQGLQGLQPDLLGEALVAQTLLGRHGANLLDAVLSKGTADMRHASLTVLARLLGYRPDVAAMLEEAIVQNLPACASELIEVCLETPSPLPALMERAFQLLTKQQRWQMAGAVGKQIEFNVQPLLGVKVLFCKEGLDRAKQKLNPLKQQTMADYADALMLLALAHHYNGDAEAALGYTQEAVSTYQELAKTNPDRFEPDWAWSLNTYAAYLADLGQYAEALAAAQQAFDVYQRLDQAQPARYLSRYQQARLSMALWQWLATQAPLQDALAEPLPTIDSPVAARTLAFQWSALSAFALAPTDQAASAIQAALLCWAALHQAQKNRFKENYLLLAALAEHQLGADAAPAGWHSEWARYSDKKQGHRPMWMTEVAQRLGFEL